MIWRRSRVWHHSNVGTVEVEDVCFDHIGEDRKFPDYYGARIVLTGHYSPWKCDAQVTPELRKRAEELLQRSVRATRWILANCPPGIVWPDETPRDVIDTAEKGGLCVRLVPTQQTPCVMWTGAFAAFADLHGDENEMKLCGWVQQ